MKLVHNIRIAMWILVVLNLLMAFGSIWVFLRMSPVIDNILKKNTRTLASCELMLAGIAQMRGEEAEDEKYRAQFLDAFNKAKQNVTEKGEPYQLEQISVNYAQAFAGDKESVLRTVEAIVKLSDINRSAMFDEDRRAKKLGSAGAWGVVFMATAVFIMAMILMRSVRRSLIHPIEEIYAVVDASLKGDSMRRCYGTDLPREVKILYSGINEVLDITTNLDNKKFDS